MPIAKRSPARAAAALLLVALWAPPADAQRFLADDPVWRDRDDLPVPEPAQIELSSGYDVLKHSLGHRPAKGKIPRAQNVNTLGEVPDSTWWTNRIGMHPMSIAELARGPNDGDGPDITQPWTVVRGKSAGITPGFTIRDARGDLYFVKFDPERYFGLATGAEVIGSKFFHAFGYFVPTNWIVHFPRDILRIATDARVRVRGGRPRPMTPSDLDHALSRVARLPDGRIRAVASRAVPGLVVGPNEYYGTRSDDPNDVVPHEHRRELRGYRLFSAWLNHDDSRSHNSLATYVPGPGGGHLVHYLQDFASILGSGSDWRREIAPQNPRSGNEYLLEAVPTVKTALSLGLWRRPWHHIDYEVYPAVGRIESLHFDPDRWKPEYPNPAFERMLPEDAFWAARIISKFTEGAVRAIVAEADYRAPVAEDHLVRVIMERRRKVLARHLGLLNPLADFRVSRGPDGAHLEFVNHGEDAGLGVVEAYECQWFAFDNASGATAALGSPTRTRSRALPVLAAPHPYLMVQIRTSAPGVPNWKRRVDVFLRTEGGPHVVGIDRETEEDLR